LFVLIGPPGVARAQTDEIQVYNAEIAPPGTIELTIHSNYTPIGRPQPDFPGGVVPNHSLNGAFEWAYGATDFLELGVYLPVYTITNQGTPQFDGGKIRTLWVVPNAHERTFFYGVNFELSANTGHWDAHRIGLEIRPIVGWHLGRWDIILNPIIDTAFDGAGNAHFAPAERIAYNLSDKWAVAVEHYADFGPVRAFPPSSQQYHEVFGVGDYQFNEGNSVEFGVGRGITAGSDRLILKLIFNHSF
jgi:hypothetical protein